MQLGETGRGERAPLFFRVELVPWHRRHPCCVHAASALSERLLTPVLRQQHTFSFVPWEKSEEDKSLLESTQYVGQQKDTFCHAETGVLQQQTAQQTEM
eukprot:1084579-Rhodomonas_salina.1